MSIEKDLVLYLINVPAVTAIVGTRIYPKRLPENPVMPALVYQRIAESVSPTLDDDPSTYMSGIRIQIGAYGATYAEAKELMDAVMVAMSYYHGAFGNSTVKMIIPNMRLDVPDDPEVAIEREVADFTIYADFIQAVGGEDEGEGGGVPT